MGIRFGSGDNLMLEEFFDFATTTTKGTELQ